ncbi:hypothetical protein ATCVGM07011_532L [Acanthocystis turfacea Chlorella virus GM0701.1]|nr:hypothetical protein ATCVGM07011_532L [Acanthocystis turfacea Chlorella virus GM0701.1]
MTTLQYYWDDGTHTVFDGYTIDEHSVVKNKSGHVMTPRKTEDGYNRIIVLHEEKQRNIRVARAVASTFLGPPPTLRHTAEHKDKNRGNDVLSNITWEDKLYQIKNRDMPTEYKSAFIIVHTNDDGSEEEHTAKEWTNVYKKANGEKYTIEYIRKCARTQKQGFRYKVFPNLRSEVWKPVSGSNNKMGEWFISNKNRMKYKTNYAENVMTSEQLSKQEGYPSVGINGKITKCHYLSMMTFRPQEYAAKLPGDIILHKNDDRLDFNPFRLRWGTTPENGIDAHRNGKHEGKKTAQKSVASYINGNFEKNHESLSIAARYLRENGHSDANHQGVSYASENDTNKYDRTWKFV